MKAIFFDMDGVLIDSHDAWLVQFNNALHHFEKRKISKEEFDNSVWATHFDRTVKKYFRISAQELAEYFQITYHIFIKNVKIFQDTRTALEAVRKKQLKTAVLTNTHYKLAARILKDLSLFSLFDCIIGGDMVKNGKPEPDIILKALEDMELKKDDVTYIGDSIWDKIAAEKANVSFIGFRSNGDKRIENLSEILLIIEAENDLSN